MHDVAEQTTFKFSELSETAKEKARDAIRYDDRGYDWWGSIYEDATTVAELLGIQIGTHDVRLVSGKFRQDPNIYFSGFSSQGDGACFSGYYRPKLDAIETVTAYCGDKDEELIRIATGLVVLQTTARLVHGQHLDARITTPGNYSHSGTMNVDVTFLREEDGVSPPDNLERDLTDLLRKFADWIYAQLEAEDEHLCSDECLDEQLQDQEFDEDGDVI